MTLSSFFDKTLSPPLNSDILIFPYANINNKWQVLLRIYESCGSFVLNFFADNFDYPYKLGSPHIPSFAEICQDVFKESTFNLLPLLIDANPSVLVINDFYGSQSQSTVYVCFLPVEYCSIKKLRKKLSHRKNKHQKRTLSFCWLDFDYLIEPSDKDVLKPEPFINLNNKPVSLYPLFKKLLDRNDVQNTIQLLSKAHLAKGHY